MLNLVNDRNLFLLKVLRNKGDIELLTSNEPHRPIAQGDGEREQRVHLLASRASIDIEPPRLYCRSEISSIARQGGALTCGRLLGRD
jgi:hypothetical protein